MPSSFMRMLARRRAVSGRNTKSGHRRLFLETMESRAMLAAVSVADVQMIEGHAGMQQAAFVVRLDEPVHKHVVSLDVQTRDDTAVRGQDYGEVRQRISFARGQTSLTVLVPVYGDNLLEPNERFLLLLTNVTNATRRDGLGMAFVMNDDPANPPPANPYGPTRTVGPKQDVAAPAGAIVLSASSSTAAVQQAIDGAAAGATIYFQPGTYRDLQITPKDNQKFLGAFGAVLTSGTKTYAFRSDSQGVEIRNLVIDGYRPELQRTSVGGGQYWKVIDCEIRNSGMGGLSADSNSLLDGNYVHHNDQLGLHPEGDNIVVRNNEVSYNNAQYKFDFRWEAGGSKFWDTNNVLIENNNFHHNGGHGIWLDYNNRNAVIRWNWAHDNDYSGIYQEIGGAALIENNLVEGNGIRDTLNGWSEGAGILVNQSHDVTIRNNIVRNNKDGIIFIATDRGSSPAGVPYTSTNNRVEGNTVMMNRGRSGVVVDGNISIAGMLWQNNKYTLSGSAAFAGKSGWTLTFDAWQAEGQDKNSTLTKL